MKNIPKLEPTNERSLTNTFQPEKSESDLEMELEQHVSPEAIFKFVQLHYQQDDGNDSPATSAELEESFRSYITQLGYRGPKVEMFIQRAMSSIDDYDYSDKFDNINQTLGSDYGRKTFSNDIDDDLMMAISETKWHNEEPDLGSSKSLKNNDLSFRDKHKNNPFYIDPFAPKKPF